MTPPPRESIGARVRRLVATVGAIAIAMPLIVAAVILPAGSSAEAASGSDFNPGNIISDSVFFDGNAMSATAVQSFLQAQVPVCETWHAGSGANQPPFTCLKDYVVTHPTEPADAYCTQIPAGTRTAAQIIAIVGQACGISQKVLLVLLQKEQSLVTDTWPWERQYRSATGYGCPDTADCDSRYYGFFNQVVMAAWQFKYYAANPQRYAYRPGQWNTIQWHPDASCGTTSVYIENSATAALYIYTPYVPNAASLANMYGTGDGCSTYGNRNFWRLFTDWFGPTTDVACVANPNRDLNKFWQDNGAANGVLGAAIAPGIVAGPNGVTIGHYAGGNTYCIPRSGPVSVMGDLRTKYDALGSVSGVLGAPYTAATALSAGGVSGRAQTFVNGMMVSSAQTGTFAVLNGAMRTAWGERGGSGGTLGWPTGDQQSTGSGIRQQFQRGVLVVATNGSSVVLSSQVATYWSTGTNSVRLGLPVGAITTLAAGGMSGFYQNFENGMAVVWPSGSVYSVLHGPIRNVWGASGGSGGSLGWPTGDQIAVSGGYRQDFQRGTVFASSAGVGSTLSGAIATYWSAGSNGAALGYPLSPQKNWTAGGVSGVLQEFELGTVLSSASTGTFAVLHGPVRQAWGARGGSGGTLGWPTGDQVVSASAITQAFQGGSVTVPLTTGTSGAIAAYWATGSNAAKLGASVASATSLTAGGISGSYQVFERGMVLSSATTGTFAVLNGPIRDAWGAQNGSGGPLGWPTGDQSSFSGGVRQQFQGGLITVPAGGGNVAMAGAIADYWSAGTNALALGSPTDPMVAWTANGISGVYQVFQRGMVMSSETTGTFSVVNGAIRSVWGELGGSGGSLGWPTGDRETYASGIRQTFQLGVVLVPHGSSPIVLSGDIAAFWTAGSNSALLGQPTGSSTSLSAGGIAGAFQNFERGMVLTSAQTGTHAVLNGPIRDVWGARGGSGGDLGWPTGEQAPQDGGLQQQFSSGTVSIAASGTTTVLAGAFYRYWTEGSNASTFGAPSGSSLAWSAGGVTGSYQVFAGGMVMSSDATGTHGVLNGPIRDLWGANNGSGGSLGWPTGEPEATSDGIRQQFQHGAIVVPTGGSAYLVMG